MKTFCDIQRAEKNHLVLNNGKLKIAWGHLAERLYFSSEFQKTSCAFSVWELNENRAILRANQSSLENALRYMTTDNRVLVWNEEIPESHPTN